MIGKLLVFINPTGFHIRPRLSNDSGESFQGIYKE